MELKAILAVMLCLVIAGGAVYLHIKKKEIRAEQKRDGSTVPFACQ